ncbi:plasma membrane calcium [Blyttiomyces sp. JEL0837]|nr:plasma membrane calcium [Blyttiomyces sp. JEL0837]
MNNAKLTNYNTNNNTLAPPPNFFTSTTTFTIQKRASRNSSFASVSSIGSSTFNSPTYDEQPIVSSKSTPRPKDPEGLDLDLPTTTATQDRYGVGPSFIHKMLDPKSPELLEKIGGVEGLVKRLRTHVITGLSAQREEADGPWWALSSGIRAMSGGSNVRRSSTVVEPSRRNTTTVGSLSLSSPSPQPPLNGSGADTEIGSSPAPMFLVTTPDGSAAIHDEPAEFVDEPESTTAAGDESNNGGVSHDSELGHSDTITSSAATTNRLLSVVGKSNTKDTFATLDSQGNEVYDPFAERKVVFGNNTLPEPEMKTLWQFAWEALQDKTLIILCAAAVADVAIGIYKATFAEEKDPYGFVDGVAIILAVLLIVMISSINDYRKQGQFRELNDFSKSLTKCQVIRDGKTRQINTRQLLVGDIVSFAAGDVLPADGILIQSFNVSCDESSLTGETVAVVKDAKHDPFLLSGTKVVNGLGRMVVVATGSNSLNGRLLAALEVEPEETPLQEKLGKLADQIAKFGLIAAVFMVVVLLIMYFTIKTSQPRDTVKIVNSVIGLFIVGITLVVVAVPEGLPLAVTLALAHATLRMLKDNNLVRHLRACETMGNATTVCSDKTGTLTQNRMTVIVGTVSSRFFGALPTVNSTTLARRSASIKSHGSGTPSRSNTAKSNNNSPYPQQSDVDGYLAINELTLHSIRSTTATSNFAHDEDMQIVDSLDGIPSIVINHIAKSINVNTTADEVTAADTTISPSNDSTTPAEPPLTRKTSSASASGIKGGLFHHKDTSTIASYPPTPPTEFIGSKTEVALLKFTQKRLCRPYKSDREASDVVEVIPFSSDRKRMSTIIRVPTRERDGALEDALFGPNHVPLHHLNASKNSSGKPIRIGSERGEKYWLFCKGAAEIVLKCCDRYLNNEGRVVEMTPEVRADYEATIQGMASSALRTICVAFKPHMVKKSDSASGTGGDSKNTPVIKVDGDGEVDEHEGLEADEYGLILAAIVGIQDPIRPEVPGAVKDCERAGIVVRMVTGDNLATARSIATLAGILDPDGDDIVMEGPKFRELSSSEMDIVLPRLRVLARSSPLDKQILVQNLKRLGETVAVTGDGTNDAPALKRADVGFSMGIAGTEVAKEASDIILLDDNFVSLAKAIIWGRSVYDSVRKFLQFQLTVNIVAVILTIFTSFLTALLTPDHAPVSVLSAVQLLWVNLIMDTFAALALATDPPTPELLDRPPARRSDPLISFGMWKMVVGQSIYQVVVCMVLYLTYSGIATNGRVLDDYDLGVDLRTATIVFNAFVFCQVFNEINCRVIGNKLNIFKGIMKNHIFLGIAIGTVITQIIIVEFGSRAFKTMPLNGMDWGICLVVGLFSLPLGVIIRLTPDWAFGRRANHTSSTFEDETPVIEDVKGDATAVVVTSSADTLAAEKKKEKEEEAKQAMPVVVVSEVSS